MHLSKKKLLLSIDHATVRYLDKTLFPHLTFHIREGEQWAVTGKSGSGKTALLNTIMGKYNVIHGRLRYPFYEDFLEKHPTTDIIFSPRLFISYVSFQPHFKNKQNTGDFYYQQRFHAWEAEEAVTVREYLEETGSKLSGYLRYIPVRFPRAWIIEAFNLDYLLDKTLIQLSNGETRRLLFAHALLRQPRLLLLDNSLSGLDAGSRIFYSRLLTQITQKETAIVLVTPASEIPGCITHVLELDQGEVTGIWPRAAFIPPKEEAADLWRPDRTKLQDLLEDRRRPGNYKIAIQLDNVHVQYGNTVILDGIDWTVKQGEKWALTGHNGAGKSTLLSLITGDNPQAYANHIILFDKKRGKGESIWDIKAKIGYVSPELHRYFPANSSCLEVILSGYTDTMIPIRKKTDGLRLAHAIEWMELFQVDSLKDRRFKFVSAGEQRLILLLRALVKNPPLLILDEPCQGLDREQITHFKNIIDQVCAARDKTLVYVTHYKEEIPGSVTHFITLDHGTATITEDRDLPRRQY